MYQVLYVAVGTPSHALEQKLHLLVHSSACLSYSKIMFFLFHFVHTPKSSQQDCYFGSFRPKYVKTNLAIAFTAPFLGAKYPSTYSYDESSGMYYDSATSLYYDPNTQVSVLHSYTSMFT